MLTIFSLYLIICINSNPLVSFWFNFLYRNSWNVTMVILLAKHPWTESNRKLPHKLILNIQNEIEITWWFTNKTIWIKKNGIDCGSKGESIKVFWRKKWLKRFKIFLKWSQIKFKTNQIIKDVLIDIVLINHYILLSYI